MVFLRGPKKGCFFMIFEGSKKGVFSVFVMFLFFIFSSIYIFFIFYFLFFIFYFLFFIFYFLLSIYNFIFYFIFYFLFLLLSDECESEIFFVWVMKIFFVWRLSVACLTTGWDGVVFVIGWCWFNIYIYIYIYIGGVVWSNIYECGVVNIFFYFLFFIFLFFVDDRNIFCMM